MPCQESDHGQRRDRPDGRSKNKDPQHERPAAPIGLALPTPKPLWRALRGGNRSQLRSYVKKGPKNRSKVPCFWPRFAPFLLVSVRSRRIPQPSQRREFAILISGNSRIGQFVAAFRNPGMPIPELHRARTRHPEAQGLPSLGPTNPGPRCARAGIPKPRDYHPWAPPSPAHAIRGLPRGPLARSASTMGRRTALVRTKRPIFRHQRPQLPSRPGAKKNAPPPESPENWGHILRTT